MNFRKKTIGGILDMTHIWVAKRSGNDLTIHFDDKKGDFWFVVERDGKKVYDSSEEDIYFSTLNEAESFVESWVQEKLFGRVKKNAKLSMEKKYRVLLEAVKRFVEKNRSYPGADELNTVLKKINEG